MISTNNLTLSEVLRIPPGDALDAMVGKSLGLWCEDDGDGRGPTWYGWSSKKAGWRVYACVALGRLWGPSYRSSNALPLFSEDWSAAMTIRDQLVTDLSSGTTIVDRDRMFCFLNNLYTVTCLRTGCWPGVSPKDQSFIITTHSLPVDFARAAVLTDHCNCWQG